MNSKGKAEKHRGSKAQSLLQEFWDGLGDGFPVDGLDILETTIGAINTNPLLVHFTIGTLTFCSQCTHVLKISISGKMY